MSETVEPLSFQSKINTGYYYGGDVASRRAKSDEFMKDLLAHLGLTGHPKAEKLFSMAWNQGHASGYSEVAYYAEELAELLK